MTPLDALTGLVIALGLVGIVVMVLPGTVMILGALLVWAALVGETAGWVVFAVAATFLVVGQVVKYAVPGRRMKDVGVPGSTLAAGGLLGVVGFFVIPVVGLPLGFVVGRVRRGAPARGGHRRPRHHRPRAARGRAVPGHRARVRDARGARLGGRRGGHVTVLLALSGAVFYGLSDFVGGIASRRTSAWSVALTAALSGAVFVLLAGLTLDGDPTRQDLAWGVLAGVGNGFGTAFLYRGLSSGRMGVVAPISAVGAALVPVAVGLVGGERPAGLVWLGIAAAFPGIWCVSQDPAADSPGARGGVVDGVLAGLGFGVLFAALGQVPEEAGLLPLAINQLVGAAVIIAVALALRVPWVPREKPAAYGVVCGALGAAATVAFLLATQSGALTVAAVLASLYPAVTILLAAVVLKEPVHRVQGVGLALCGVAVALVAAG